MYRLEETEDLVDFVHPLESVVEDQNVLEELAKGSQSVVGYYPKW